MFFSVNADFSIRAYRDTDLPRLQEITIDTFGPVSIDGGIERLLGHFGHSDWRTRKAAAIAEDCRVQPDGVFVAEDAAGMVVGYITTRLDRASRTGWIPNLAVDPAQQGKGIGRALVTFAIKFFRESGMEIARIETLEQNQIGQKLYPSVGFIEVARQIHYAMRLERQE